MIAMLVEDMLLDLGHELVAVPILSKAVQPGSSGLCHQRCLRPEVLNSSIGRSSGRSST
jgi:hypothetical protein